MITVSTIYKYHLLYDRRVKTSPLIDPKVLHVGFDGADDKHAYVWVQNTIGPEPTAAITTVLNFRIIGTGHQFAPADAGQHVGSFVDAPFVWHVFCKEEAPS